MTLSGTNRVSVFGLAALGSIALLFQTTLHGESALRADRSPHNPLITPASSSTLGDNINGPSVIKVPEWIPDPLGKYYLYFAHHHGEYIRLAYSDHLEGPWRIYEPGTAHVDEFPLLESGLASPDVHVDHDEQKIYMFCHGHMKNSSYQRTMVSVSKDGIEFQPGQHYLTRSYLRVFFWDGYFYGIDGSGGLIRSQTRDRVWEKRQEKLIKEIRIEDQFGRRDRVRFRHGAVLVKDNQLWVFYTRKEDAPERIIYTQVDLEEDWEDWTMSPPVELLRPEEVYEGTHFERAASASGAATQVCQLRDPYVFEDAGRYYLFYSIAGESGIAMAELIFKTRQ